MRLLNPIRSLFILFFLVNACLTHFASAQEDSSYWEMPIEDLMHVKVVLPALVQQESSEAPSIVTVVSRQEIESYGDRDIADILRRIPGFEFGLDTLNIVGASFRGIWAHEGKMLVMLNGVTINDLGFGNVTYFGSFPASMIDRVEVLRGPGSAIYGGFAEVGIINIVTRKGADLNGVSLQGSVGAMGTTSDLMSRSGDLAWGTKTEDLETSMELGVSQYPLSGKTYTDFSGNQLVMGNNSTGRKWFHLIAHAKYKENLVFKYFRTQLLFLAQNLEGIIAPPINNLYQERALYSQEGFNASYVANVSSKLKITPVFEYLTGPHNGQEALQSGQYSFVNGPNSGSADRFRGEVTMAYQPEETSNLILGLGYIRDNAEYILANGDQGLYQSSQTDRVFKRATESGYILGQYLRKFGAFGITTGTRFEVSSFGNALAPRLGLTYQLSELNLKLLYGRSYRIPMPIQAYSVALAFNPAGLKPETTNTVEAEVGYSFSPTLSAKINAFFTEIDQIITFIGGENFYYANSDQPHQSYGFESEVSYRESRYGAFLNASLALPGAKVSTKFVPSDNRHFLAFPPIKVNFGGYFLLGNIAFGPTFTILTERYGQNADAVTSMPLEAVFLANLAITWNNIFENAALRLTCHNILNSDYLLIQPYFSGTAAMPAQDREFRLEFQAKF